MIIYEPITMLNTIPSMVGKSCISKSGKQDLGVITLVSPHNSVISSNMASVGFEGSGYYNWLAIFGYPTDYSIQALLKVITNMDNIKCLITDYGPHNNQIVEILC